MAQSGVKWGAVVASPHAPSSFLTGEFRHTLDDRSRVAVPVRFRARLAEGATLARWLDDCLGLFPQDAWDELADKLRSLPLTNPRAREFARFMSSGRSRSSSTSRAGSWSRATCASTPASPR